MGSPLRVRFWGTRGMISSPRTTTEIYGGNTTCLQLLFGRHLIIIDAGFGISNLGEQLMARILGGGEALDIHIFLTHFHWDHIQGLPFFHPIYFPSSKLTLYSPQDNESSKENINPLFDGSYSPFSGIESMPSEVTFKQMVGTTEHAGLEFSYCLVDHGATAGTGGKTYAFKIVDKSKGTSVVFAPDHEARIGRTNDKFVSFAKDCDLLIHNAQYTEEEYRSKRGWGNSSFQQAVDNCEIITPSKALLTHHDPLRDDRELVEMQRNLLAKSIVNIEFAKEGIDYEVPTSDKGEG